MYSDDQWDKYSCPEHFGNPPMESNFGFQFLIEAIYEESNLFLIDWRNNG